MTRGGARPGAGRKPTGKTTIKATIYIKDRDMINNYAKSLEISVNELIHRIFTNKKFEEFLETLK